MDKGCVGGAVGVVPGTFAALRPCCTCQPAAGRPRPAQPFGWRAPPRTHSRRLARRSTFARRAALHAGRGRGVSLYAACRIGPKKPVALPLACGLHGVPLYPAPGRAVLYRPPPPRAAKAGLTRAAVTCGRYGWPPYAAPKGLAVGGAFCARGGFDMGINSTTLLIESK